MDSQAITNTDELIAWLAQLPAFAASSGWGIGGSCLLKHLGLVEHSRDVDVVCTEADFHSLYAALAEWLEPVQIEPHPLFCSRHFAKFRCGSGLKIGLEIDLEIELMAGIAVRDEQSPPGKIDWHFDPTQVQKSGGIPWMHATQWQNLYQLFGRTASAQRLANYLAGRVT